MNWTTEFGYTNHERYSIPLRLINVCLVYKPSGGGVHFSDTRRYLIFNLQKIAFFFISPIRCVILNLSLSKNRTTNPKHVLLSWNFDNVIVFSHRPIIYKHGYIFIAIRVCINGGFKERADGSDSLHPLSILFFCK